MLLILKAASSSIKCRWGHKWPAKYLLPGTGVDFGGKAAEPGRYAFIAQAVRDGKSQAVNSFAATRVTGVSWDQNSGKAFHSQVANPFC